MNRFISSAILVILGGISAATGQETPAPGGWGHAGARSQYRVALDSSTSHGGKFSGCVRSTSNEPGDGAFGAFQQLINAKNYRGKRVRLAGFVKTREVQEWSGLWMRIDAPRPGAGFDNMQDRPIKGTTDWERYEVVLDVPGDAIQIALGVLQAGAGQTWIDDMVLETVGDDVAVTKPAPARDSASSEFSVDRLARLETSAAGLPDAIANADFEQSRLDDHLALMQGRWEAEKPAEYEPASTYGRITKQIEGNRETVTFYGVKGDVLQAHVVDFALEQSGRVTLFTFCNFEVTAGPSKGQKWPASRSFSYLFTVSADTFVEILGALDGDSGLPRLTVWKRANEN